MNASCFCVVKWSSVIMVEGKGIFLLRELCLNNEPSPSHSVAPAGHPRPIPHYPIPVADLAHASTSPYSWTVNEGSVQWWGVEVAGCQVLNVGNNTRKEMSHYAK